MPEHHGEGEEASAMMVEFQKRFMNSARTVDSGKSVSGERPSERQPDPLRREVTQGIMLPCITSGAILKRVVSVQ